MDGSGTAWENEIADVAPKLWTHFRLAGCDSGSDTSRGYPMLMLLLLIQRAL